jgi:hypothetical protein
MTCATWNTLFQFLPFFLVESEIYWCWAVVFLESLEWWRSYKECVVYFEAPIPHLGNEKGFDGALHDKEKAFTLRHPNPRK